LWSMSKQSGCRKLWQKKFQWQHAWLFLTWRWNISTKLSPYKDVQSYKETKMPPDTVACGVAQNVD
jgi:hypothetical protein